MNQTEMTDVNDVIADVTNSKNDTCNDAQDGDVTCANKDDVTDQYFTSYEDLSVHELMLKDRPRTEAYRDFIYANREAFRDQIVMDVGAGTGILSLFAAKAGAKKVYAVEASGSAALCRQIVTANGYDDVIEVIQSRVEDVKLPVKQVDILMSEWMGFYLLHEAMLGSVIYARDTWLAPGGLMLPSSATLYICPVNLKLYVAQNITYWDNVYGFDFAPFRELVEQKHRSQPSIQTLDASQCIANAQEVIELQLLYVDTEELCTIRRKLQFEINKNSICHGFAAWFECAFELTVLAGATTDTDAKRVVLNTGPSAPATHWQQTVILLPEPLMLSKKELIGCSLTLTQDSTNHRHYNIAIELDEEEEEEDGQYMDSEAEQTSNDPVLTDDVTQLIVNAMSSKNK